MANGHAFLQFVIAQNVPVELTFDGVPDQDEVIGRHADLIELGLRQELVAIDQAFISDNLKKAIKDASLFDAEFSHPRILSVRLP
ncbi:hypothetical protein AE618_06425 [Bosea vaviloviae]|uniref:Uncharacterized protein n=1 Tax=Bosea vaviloviae TaxID=1526658 RepID=A0A0N0MD41_9HYPH|nr:hypothetical protein AE618_06425 [Bosea vaviloviae]